MRTYSSIEKDKIILFGDLVRNPLTLEDQYELTTSGIAPDSILKGDFGSIEKYDSLIEKIRELNSNNMMIGTRILSLENRGAYVIFPDEDVPDKRISNLFIMYPQILFAVGDKERLTDSSSEIITGYYDFISSKSDVLYIADKPLDWLINDKSCRYRIMNSNSLIISDQFYHKARIRDSEMNISKVHSSQDKSSIVNMTQSNKSSSTKKFFIYGSRWQDKIDKNVQDFIDKIVSHNFDIIIGDSVLGVDKQILDYLRSPLYKSVSVYSIKEKPRVPIDPSWNFVRVYFDSSVKNAQKQQMEKDRKMAEAANWGVAVFNPVTINRFNRIEVSSGTLRNTIQMLLNRKAVKFFYIYSGYTLEKNLHSVYELKDILESYNEEEIPPKTAELIIAAAGPASGSTPASIVKAEKLIKKYNELLNDEMKYLNTESDGQMSFI